MRLFILAAALVIALTGCGSKSSESDKDKDKKDDVFGPKQGQIAVPAQVAGMGSPVQQAAQKLVMEIRSPDPVDLNKVTARFLKVIGKPLTPNAEDQTRKYSANEANVWLKRAGESFGFDGNVGATPGFVREGAAVFVGSYSSAAAPKGRYLMRLVEEGGAWKLDWFQVSATEANDPPTADDPFKDFAAQAAADLFAGGPMPAQDRAPLAAALWSSNCRTAMSVNQPEDSMGLDYKRAELATKLDTFLGSKAGSYQRSSPGTEVFKTEFTLAGGGKKTVEFKIMKGEGPGNWVVEEIK